MCGIAGLIRFNHPIAPDDVAAVRQRADLQLHRGPDDNGLFCAAREFRLGSRIRCPNCLRNSWFPLESIREQFACPKCLRAFPAAGSLTGSSWSYKAAGPFSVPGYADGAYAVRLTLEFFSERRMSTLRTTPVLSFTAEAPHKAPLEADFALLWQESIYGEQRDGIIFGECQTYSRFGEKDFQRMRHLAKLFPGAVLVLSTLRKSLTPYEIRQITRIAKAGRKYWRADRPLNPLLLLTGTELLNWDGPPYCWGEELRRVDVRERQARCPEPVINSFCRQTQRTPQLRTSSRHLAGNRPGLRDRCPSHRWRDPVDSQAGGRLAVILFLILLFSVGRQNTFRKVRSVSSRITHTQCHTWILGPLGAVLDSFA